MAKPSDLVNDGVDSQVSALAAGVDLEREMDRLSLEQALRDVEIANGRAIDLTQRLLEANEQILKLQAELDGSTMVMRTLQGPIALLKRTFVGRVARRIRNLLRAISR